MTGFLKLQVGYTVWIKNVTSKYPHSKYYFSKKLFIYFLFCLWKCLCTISMVGAFRSQKRALEPLGLELQISVSPEVDGGNRTWISESTASALNCWANSSVPHSTVCCAKVYRMRYTALSGREILTFSLLFWYNGRWNGSEPVS